LTRLAQTYRCLDGSEFPVQFVDEEEAAAAWEWDAEHSARAAAPLDQCAWLDGVDGFGRARTECGYAETDYFFSGTRFFNGFWYFRIRPRTEQELALRALAVESLRKQFAGESEMWKQRCEPLCRRSINELRQAPDHVSVKQLIDIYAYGFEQTFVLDYVDRAGLRQFLNELVGEEEEAERTLSELSAGFPSATMQANQAVWEMAQLAREVPALRRALAARDLDVPAAMALAGADEFQEAFERFLERYGGRTLGWHISTPTYRERPEMLLGLISRTVEEDIPEPAKLVAAAAERRELLVEEFEARIVDHTKLAEFRRLLSRQESYLGIKEGRAAMQLSLGGSLREALMRRGRELAARGVLDSQEDLFYLFPDEIDAALAGKATGDLRAQIGRRRAEQEHWLSKTPPEVIGAASPPVEEGPGTTLKGIAVSRGKATGRARVLATYEEGERLAPGDVLVCGTTTPSWTPLFGIASAIVAEGGGLLSHTGIAAREYGIPAVTNVRGATRLIADGATVTVDGSTGAVIVGQQA
jgi:phosphohistidine swiveling domain-containing protein